jgi:lipooligosaccharide transport system permease protein
MSAAQPVPVQVGRSVQAGTLASRSARGFLHWLVNYRRTWKGSIYSSVLNPVLYLGAMGLGLGTLVDKHGTASLGGVSYLTFLAPGLLAASAMQTAVGESMYPVFSAVKWQQTYQAAAATPLRPGDIFRGHVLFTTMRLIMNVAIFMAIMAAFGAVKSPWVIAAFPVAVLTGLAFAAPLDAFAVTQKKNDQAFNVIFRFGMIPLFLFSGTFFPVTQLPGWIRPLAYITPLWHGVALCRALSLGTADLAGALGHVAYLLVVALAGLIAGTITYRRRLYV